MGNITEPRCTVLTEGGRSKEKGALSSDAVALQLDQTATKRPGKAYLEARYMYTVIPSNVIGH